MKFDYKTLVMLRKNTRLGPLAYLQVMSQRTDAREYQAIMNHLEHCQLAVDDERADQLEAELRFEVWKRKLMATWLKYYNYRELDEFALDVLKQREEEESKKLSRKKRNHL